MLIVCRKGRYSMTQENIQSGVSCRTAKKRTGGEILTQSALTYIESHYKEKFSLQTMAGELFVNGSYLLRVFKKYTGYTPLAYHNHVRCEQAKKLLSSTNASISDIGETVGFVSLAHFSHIFRKIEGCTPSEYKISHCVYWKKEDVLP